METTISSPLGPVRLVARDRALVAVRLPRGGNGSDPSRVGFPDGADGNGDEETREILERAESQLEAYFAGTLRRFSIPLGGSGTPFQDEVWRGLRAIPYGETRSYGWVARTIGRPKASRAVGAANGRNPLAIVVPCHRVIGADGSLTGYGGGLEAKRWLLEHERERGA